MAFPKSVPIAGKLMWMGPNWEGFVGTEHRNNTLKFCAIPPTFCNAL